MPDLQAGLVQRLLDDTTLLDRGPGGEEEEAESRRGGADGPGPLSTPPTCNCRSPPTSCRIADPKFVQKNILSKISKIFAKNSQECQLIHFVSSIEKGY